MSVPAMKPVTFDGWLVAILAMMPAAIAWLCGDEAAKFIPAWLIFYGKGGLSILGVGLGALKAFRSTQYATYKANGNGDLSCTPKGNTEFITKPPPAP